MGWGVFLPSPCPILTTVCSFLGFSPSERALFGVSIDSFLPAASSWPPGMNSISRGARKYSRVVTCVVAAAFGTLRDVPVTTVSLYVAVATRIGNGAVDTSRRECGTALSLVHNQMAVPSLHSVSRCATVSTVSAAIRLHEPDWVQALVSRHYIMYDDVPHGCDFLRYPELM